MIFPGKVLGRGASRVSARQRVEKTRVVSPSSVVSARARSQTRALPTAAPTTPASLVRRSHASVLTPDEIARRHEQSRKRDALTGGKARSVPDGSSLKRQKTDSSPLMNRGTVVPPSPTLESGRKAFALARAELIARVDQVSLCFEEETRSHDETKRFVTELVEKNRALEDDVASLMIKEEELCGKLSRMSLRHIKVKEENASLRKKLVDAEDLQIMKVAEAVAEAKGEVARGFAGRTKEVTKLLGEIEGTAKDNMLDLAEIDASLEFIERVRKPDGLTLEALEKLFLERKAVIYDARDVFGELVSGVRQALEIPEEDVVVDEDEGADE